MKRLRYTDDEREFPGVAAPASAGSAEIHTALVEIRREILAAESEAAQLLEALPERVRSSAENLVHYLTLRNRDLRDLQDGLTRCGLSSLGRSEPHVMWTVDAVLDLTSGAGDERPPARHGQAFPPEEAWRRIESNTAALLGPRPDTRTVRIIVTMPSEAATDYELVRDLIAVGMDCMRINCAHDGPEAWDAMIGNLRRAEAEVGRSCKLLMDLPGPRVRTGPLEPGAEVVRIEPDRDPFGRLLEPARVWLAPERSTEPPPGEADAVLPLPVAFLETLEVGDEIEFEEPSGAHRRMRVDALQGAGRWARLSEPAHVTTGMLLHRRSPQSGASPASAEIGHLPPKKPRIQLQDGDTLILTRSDVPGRPATRDPETGKEEPARIGCQPAEALENVRPGERIWFDDGRIGGVIDSVGAEEIVVRITRTRPGGDKLRPEKGINLPDSDLRLPPLTAYDLEILPFIASRADLVGYSFVGTAEHVRQLREAMERVGGDELGIVLKIERELAFRELPRLLLEGLKAPRLGVMIARGDLAVECGFARMAEVQEEILWLCAAAHVPVIWATQVMEQLAKAGRPSRAEVTDAAMGGRAECIMLNKGPHITDAVRALISILERMQEHQQKKRAMLRRLDVASRFFTGS